MHSQNTQPNILNTHPVDSTYNLGEALSNLYQSLKDFQLTAVRLSKGTAEPGKATAYHTSIKVLAKRLGISEARVEGSLQLLASRGLIGQIRTSGKRIAIYCLYWDNFFVNSYSKTYYAQVLAGEADQ